jgi:hypothetical protein
MLFLPDDDKLAAQSKAILEEVLAKEGLTLVAYRPVPVKHEVVGRFAKATQPRFVQVVVKGAAAGDALERQLFIARKEVEREARKAMGEAAADFYICSLSSRWEGGRGGPARARMRACGMERALLGLHGSAFPMHACAPPACALTRACHAQGRSARRRLWLTGGGSGGEPELNRAAQQRRGTGRAAPCPC